GGLEAEERQPKVPSPTDWITLTYEAVDCPIKWPVAFQSKLITGSLRWHLAGDEKASLCVVPSEPGGRPTVMAAYGIQIGVERRGEEKSESGALEACGEMRTPLSSCWIYCHLASQSWAQRG